MVMLTTVPPVSEPQASDIPPVSEPQASDIPPASEASQASEAPQASEAITVTEPTQAPAPFVGSPLFYGGIALALALIAAAVLLFLKRRTGREKPEPAPVTAELPTTAARAETSEVAEEAAPEAPQSSSASDEKGIWAGVHHHIGAREDQQDSFQISDLNAYEQIGVMAVVADGMGGLANGKAVSSALVDTFIGGFYRYPLQYHCADILLDLAATANERINEMLRGQERSGSTLVAALIRGGYLHFLTVGDSRIYLYRGGALIQLNREHIYQEELAVEALNREISMNQVRSDRQAHALTSYIGIGTVPSIDRNDEGIRLVPGDRLLLCSDGIFGTLSAAQLEEALANPAFQAAKVIGEAIALANEPYQDNNTAVILEYKG